MATISKEGTNLGEGVECKGSIPSFFSGGDSENSVEKIRSFLFSGFPVVDGLPEVSMAEIQKRMAAMGFTPSTNQETF